MIIGNNTCNRYHHELWSSPNELQMSPWAMVSSQLTTGVTMSYGPSLNIDITMSYEPVSYDPKVYHMLWPPLNKSWVSSLSMTFMPWITGGCLKKYNCHHEGWPSPDEQQMSPWIMAFTLFTTGVTFSQWLQLTPCWAMTFILWNIRVSMSHALHPLNYGWHHDLYLHPLNYSCQHQPQPSLMKNKSHRELWPLPYELQILPWLWHSPYELQVSHY
jgi:hypothetical protein